MKSPQLENGYTRIANEILETLSKTQISGNDRRILDVIFRKTYGFNKKQDKISLSQFSVATLLMRSVVCRGLKRLINMNIIIKIANDDIQIYRINKDFDTWKPLAELRPPVAELLTTISKTANVGSRKTATYKRQPTKETLTKDISEQSSQDISRFIKLFESVNPSYEKFYGNKTQRSAVGRLLKKYGFEKSAGMVKYLPIINADKYAKGKSITPLQLEDNLALIIAHYNQNKNSKFSIDIIS